MAHAKDFTDLNVYLLAEDVAWQIFEMTRSFPKEEMYSLTDQIRRSSRSIGAQIAEAWAKRRYEKHFVLKLTDADGEQRESRHWLRTAKKCGYVDDDQFEKLTSQLNRVGRMLGAMIRSSHDFCGITDEVRDDSPEVDWYV